MSYLSVDKFDGTDIVDVYVKDSKGVVKESKLGMFSEELHDTLENYIREFGIKEIRYFTYDDRGNELSNRKEIVD